MEKKRGLNTIYNFDVELSKADQMFNSFFNEENIKKRKSKRYQKLQEDFDKVYYSIKDKKDFISKLEEIKRDQESIKKKDKVVKIKNKEKTEIKKLQNKAKSIRRQITSLDKYVEKITVKTSFGEFKVTYKQVYENAGSTTEFFKKKLIEQIRKKAKDLKKEKKYEENELKQVKPTSKKGKGIVSHIKGINTFLENIDDIIDNIKQEDDYPIMYDFNSNNDLMRLYVVGFRGAARYRKQRNKFKKTNTDEDFESFDFEEDLKTTYKRKK